MWPAPICVPSFIFIHLTVWPQYTNVTDRQDRTRCTDSGTIGRTVLQTVAQQNLTAIIDRLRLVRCTRYDIKTVTPYQLDDLHHEKSNPDVDDLADFSRGNHEKIMRRLQELNQSTCSRTAPRHYTPTSINPSTRPAALVVPRAAQRLLLN